MSCDCPSSLVFPPCPVPVNIPGPPGQPPCAYLTANLIVPANTIAQITISLSTTSWLLPGMDILVSDAVDGHANFNVVSIGGPNTATVTWVNATGDSVSGTVFNLSNGPIACATGVPGASSNGVNAFSVLTANLVVPPDFVTSVTASVANSQWITVGETIIIGNATDGHATFTVTSVPSSTSVTLLWLNARADAGSGSTLTVGNGSTVSAAGVPGTFGARFASTIGNPNSGVLETNLTTYALPAGSLSNNGDSIDIEGVFDFASNGNNKTVKLKFGASTVLTCGAAAQNGGSLVIKARVVRVNNTNQRFYGYGLVTSGSTMNAVTVNDNAAAETLSGTVNIVFTGTGGANSDIVQQTMIVRYAPI